MLGVFQLAFSHFAFAVDSNPGTPSSEINVDLVNGIAVRILDEAGQQQIDNINLDLIAAPGGSYISGKFNVEVSTSNKTGYKLYMDSSYDQSSVMGTTSPDYTTNLVNQTNTSYVIPTLANDVTLSEFQSGSNNSSNKWGYSLDDASFSPIPVHATPDMVDSSSAPTASTLTPVTIGTNVNMDMASGVYKNQLTFTAVAEPIPIGYTLAYDANGGTGAPASQSSTTSSGSATFTISSTKPTRKNFIFVGWADSASATTATYQPGDSITVTPEGWDDTTKTLYAVWQATPFWTITDMQEMTPEICDSLYTPSNATGSAVTLVSNASAYSVVTGDNQPYVAQRTLYDIRDNNSYTIRKLADGNCWMTSNLKYTLTANTDAIGVDHATNNTFTFNTDAACSGNGACIMNANTKIVQIYDGYYYSWYAATAGTGTASMASGDATGSICPKGWRLPANYTSDPDKSYGSITNAYLGFSDNRNENHAATLEAVPLQFLRAGYYGGGTFYNGGTLGFYWSSTASTAANGYNLYYTTSYTYPQNSNAEYYGFSVRCVAQ